MQGTLIFTKETATPGYMARKLKSEAPLAPDFEGISTMTSYLTVTLS